MAARVGKSFLVRWNFTGLSGRGIEALLVKGRKNLNANTRPSLRPRIHLLRGEPHTGEPTWGTRGARAASLRATLTWYPRAAPAVSGGRAKLWICAQNVLQTYRRNSQTMIVPQKPPQAPATAKQTSSVMNQTAASVSPSCRCLTHQKSLCQERQEWHLYLLKMKYPAQTQSSVHSPLPQNALLTQPRSQKVTFLPTSEREWASCQRVRSRHHHLCPHHHPRLAVAPNSGVANVAIAAKPNWSWFSKSWVPVAVVTSSVCSIGSRSNMSACLTTWAVVGRRPSSRWSSSTAKWAALASASGRSAPEQPFPQKESRCSDGVLALTGIWFSLLSFFFLFCFSGFLQVFLDTNLLSFILNYAYSFSIPLLPISKLFSASVGLIISLLLRRLLENPNPGIREQERAKEIYSLFFTFLQGPDYNSVSGVKMDKWMRRRNTRLYTNISPGSQFKTIFFTSKRKKNFKKRMMRRRKGWLPFVFTFALAMFIDCALYLKIRQSCFLLCAKHGLSEANPASQRQLKSVLPPGRPPPVIPNL